MADKPNGDAADAIDYALGHVTDGLELDFLNDWRSGRDLTGRWHGYLKWLTVQRAGRDDATKVNVIATLPYAVPPETLLKLSDPDGMKVCCSNCGLQCPYCEPLGG